MSDHLLLDTHALIWWVLDQGQLSRAAFSAIRDGSNALFFSPVTAMEIATKVRIGKLDFARPLASGFADQLVGRGFQELPLTAAHAELAGSIASSHNDPWDRLLAAQARIEGLVLVTNDRKMGNLGASTFW